MDFKGIPGLPWTMKRQEALILPVLLALLGLLWICETLHNRESNPDEAPACAVNSPLRRRHTRERHTVLAHRRGRISVTPACQQWLKQRARGLL
jgi:hypothetical protein